MKKYNFIIGVEIHTRLISKRKMFSKSKICCFNKFDLAIPGCMPVLNKTLVRKTILFLQNFLGDFCRKIIFYRKQYYYPDVTKGYQITQKYIKKNCEISYFDNYIYKIALIKNFHLEEDTAGIKYFNNKIYLKYNRIGIPILETVSYPCFSYGDIIFFLKLFREYCIYECYSNSRMEMGEYKFDINISIVKNNEISNKIEIKNLNSFKSVYNSLKYEMYRLIKNFTKIQETRSYSQEKKKTYFLRKKNTYFFLKEFDLKKYKMETYKRINKIRILVNNSNSYFDLIKKLRSNSFFKKSLKKQYKKKKNIIDIKLLRDIINNNKCNNDNYINYIVGIYKKTNKIFDFDSFKFEIKKLMKERDLNP